jgi:hypothetical protein
VRRQAGFLTRLQSQRPSGSYARCSGEAVFDIFHWWPRRCAWVGMMLAHTIRSWAWRTGPGVGGPMAACASSRSRATAPMPAWPTRCCCWRTSRSSSPRSATPTCTSSLVPSRWRSQVCSNGAGASSLLLSNAGSKARLQCCDSNHLLDKSRVWLFLLESLPAVLLDNLSDLP